MGKMRYVTYTRVSTAKQGASGLDLEAQEEAINRHLASVGDATVIGSFREEESGKRNDRPALKAALDMCRKEKAVLLIAKLDRLSRNLSFITGLMDADVSFVACDQPHASKFVLHIFAALAEQERDMISQRTKDAMAAAKARGVKFGGYRGTPPSDAARKLASARRKADADTTARNYADLLQEAKAAGAVSANAIARYLNSKGIKTQRGKAWQPITVRNMMKRLNNAA